MLSRSAERVYWLGRYLERAENTARIVQQYSQLLLDLPEEVGVDWAELIAIFGLVAEFEGRDTDERTVVDFLLSSADSGSAAGAGSVPAPSTCSSTIAVARRKRAANPALPIELSA